MEISSVDLAAGPSGGRVPHPRGRGEGPVARPLVVQKAGDVAAGARAGLRPGMGGGARLPSLRQTVDSSE